MSRCTKGLGHPDYTKPACPICRKAYHKKYYKEYYKNEENRQNILDSVREWNFLTKYGIDTAQYYRILLSQNCRCAICRTTDPGVNTRTGEPGEFFAVDHDHETGEVRGLLCRKCNSAIGLLGDDPDVVFAAYQYLIQARRRHAETEDQA